MNMTLCPELVSYFFSEAYLRIRMQQNLSRVYMSYGYKFRPIIWYRNRFPDRPLKNPDLDAEGIRRPIIDPDPEAVAALAIDVPSP